MSSSSINQTIILHIRSSQYLIDPLPTELAVSLEFSKSQESLGIAQPVTLISLDRIKFISHLVAQDILIELLASDDVLSLDFTKNIILQIPPDSSSPALQSQVFSLIREHDGFASLKGDLPSGPYVLLNSRLHKVFRLYPDTYGAFACGAVVVGKTKTAQLTSGMGARDWIEFQCPFNPRGDGFLDPDCSSSGSAAAVAGYGWLDCAVGSDRSMVGPASACGIYGLRPTQESLSNKGALANSALLDTPGHFTRDVSSFGVIASSWLGVPEKEYAFNPPARILFPTESFTPYVDAKLEVMESFIKDLETATKTRRTVFDINVLWKENTPEETNASTVDEFISTTLAHIQLHDSYHNNSTFRSDHQTKFNSAPYVEPLIKYKWDLGSKLTEAEYKQACAEKAIFKKFLEDHVFTPGTIMVLPGGDTDLSYRDGYPGTLKDTGKNWQGFGFTNTAFSVLGGGPCLSIPVGERKYTSQITGNETFQPVSLWILGAAVRNKRISLYYLFEATALSHPSGPCIWFANATYTWSETLSMTHRYAGFLLSLEVKPGDLVAFYLHNSPEFIFAWLGAWAIGAAPAMINYNLGGASLLHCLGISKAAVLLVDEDKALKERVEHAREHIEGLGMRVVVLSEEVKEGIRELEAQRPGDEFRDGIKGEDPMVLLYTSGTTNLPKACVFSMERGFMVCIGLRDIPPATYQLTLSRRLAGSKLFQKKDRWYNCMPFYHGTGGIVAVSSMTTGSTLCIGKRFSTKNFWNEIRDSRATWFVYVGETARYLLAASPNPLDKVHNVRGMYGNGLRPDVWLRFRDRFGVEEVCEFFGSTEGVFMLVNYARGEYLASCVGHHGAILRNLFHNVYVPVLIDPSTGNIARDPKSGFAHRQSYEKGGEIIVAVPNEQAFSGYFNNEEATQKKFERNVFKKGDLWYRTGDALRRDGDGRWLFVDRLGDTYRWKGENVSTAEVSEVMGKYPGIVEANVYGVALPGHDGRAGCAAIFIDPSARKDFDYAGLLKYTHTHLPRYAVPVFLRIVKNMTPIHNNKQNKVPLREEGVDPMKVLADDQVFWIDEKGRGTTYVEFGKKDWEALQKGKAMLCGTTYYPEVYLSRREYVNFEVYELSFVPKAIYTGSGRRVSVNDKLIQS
ncbi:hypothetical protein B7494_g2721 [Chlorociboria aeruginascens]|nr:hypothetical protein B7494_g2721 [Chlorociboria aeruginascens]